MINSLLKYSSVLLLFMAAACTTTNSYSPAPLSHKTYIIWYDGEIGKTPLLKAIAKKKGTLVYDYKNFNAVATRIPIYDLQENTTAYFQQIRGVISVQEDQRLQLH